MAAAFHILLVEDESADAELFIELFHDVSTSIQVHHVSNGQEALDFLQHTGFGELNPRPQLIVLDLNMPVMTGHEFLELAKIHDSYRSIPVLVLSTSSSAHDILQSYKLYASGYVVKPSSFADFQNLVRAISGYWQGVVTLPTINQFLA